MIRNLKIESFKSLVTLELELGRVNLFIGANGSGKSNLLEAIGILGAAAFGRVDDETLLRRGVRPGVPKLYKTAFPSKVKVNRLFFSATTDSGACFEIALWNPLENPDPAWRFMTERLERAPDDIVVTRGVKTYGERNQEQGIAALETVKLEPGDPALVLMDQLRAYSIESRRGTLLLIFEESRRGTLLLIFEKAEGRHSSLSPRKSKGDKAEGEHSSLSPQIRLLCRG